MIALKKKVAQSPFWEPFLCQKVAYQKLLLVVITGVRVKRTAVQWQTEDLLSGLVLNEDPAAPVPDQRGKICGP